MALQKLTLGALIAWGMALGCGPTTSPTTATTARELSPPAACAAAWSHEKASGLVSLLVSATQPGSPIWVDYGLDDGTYVVFAGEGTDGRACSGVWHGGEVLGYSVTDVEPKLLNPLFGYYFPWEGNNGAGRQPPEIDSWLSGLGVESAVIVPVHIEDFPIEMTDLLKVQTAIHEAFHVEVQMPQWLGPGGDWPVWDLQPDRSTLGACYAGEPEIEAAFKAERKELYDLVSALLDDDKARACEAGREFLDRRAARYEILGGVTVNTHDGNPGTCRAAEILMELEEGTADFASWTRLYELGIASRDQLMGRYQARQKDAYYLTGAMQWHALSLMDPDGLIETTKKIAVSTSPEDGSLTRLLAQQLDRYCR